MSIHAHHPQKFTAPVRQPTSTRRSIRLGALALLALGVLNLFLPVAGDALAQTANRPQVDVVDLDGTITPVMARYVERAIEDAESDHRDAVVLEMDTPGGLSSAMDDIIRDILESEVPVIVYVTPRGARAASAGTYISYAAHVAAMAPGTNIGSASPVNLGNEDDNGESTMDRKVTNDAVAQIVNLANLRGRNAEWAEQAVRDAANITADEALQMGVIDIVAPDLPTLLDQIDGRTVQMNGSATATLHTAGAELHNIDMNPFEAFLQLLADPTIAYILISLGSLGLFLELAHPGVFLPGVAGGLSLLLGLFALGTIPINWAGLLLMGFGFLLLIIDLFVPSLGSLTIGGIISFVVGSYLLIDSGAPPGYELSREAIWTVTGCMVAFFAYLGFAVMRIQFRRPATGRNALLGQIGTVRGPIEADRPGLVFVEGELWRAQSSETQPIPAGTQVAVVSISGLSLTVRPATQAESQAEAARQGAGDRRAVIPVAEVGS